MRYKTILSSAAILAIAASGALAGESTPAEKAQTRQLNIEAQTYAKGVPADQALPASVAPPFVDYGAVVQTAPVSPDASGIAKPLSTIEHPSASIANATVISSDGETIGLVQKVQLDATGRASTVDVALKDLSKTVSFSANDVSYDATKNTVIASASSDQIMNMPGSMPQG